MSDASALGQTRANQRDASHPRSSAWVIANAGAGKTHVLTQRVIRLLLAGADPAAILCLTFTKVAAAEMSRRVFGTLGAWTGLDDAALAAAIAEVEGEPATAVQMQRARRLFARALETPGGLKIQTIHAFCERLLHAFPFEANVPGQFRVMHDSAAAAALAQARDAVMDAAAREPASALGRAVRMLAETTDDQAIEKALDAVIERRDELRRWMENAAADGGAGDINDALADLRARLGLRAGESEESLCHAICDAPGWGVEDCADLAAALEGSTNRTDFNAAKALRRVLAAVGESAGADQRIDFFLNEEKDGGLKPRSVSRRFGAALRQARQGLDTVFEAEAERVAALVACLVPVRAYDATTALLTVGDAVLQAYQQAKRRAGMLDFPDLIAKTRNLLSRTEAAQWVLYKLDSRIDHILVDEAQDTSPDQWLVVKAIAEDFFSGAGAAQRPRTIFAVGDDKQSIFRFQGAVPAMLAEMQAFFATKIAEAGAGLVALPLFLSFRSTDEVLRAVDTIFRDALAREVTSATYTAHAAFRAHEPGEVVLLPRKLRRPREEPADWTTPPQAATAAETDLANAIADEIVRIRGTVLPSGKRVTEGGILVLVRRRDAFAAAMNRALRAKDIAMAGADRLPVSTHIAVLDLLALADVMLLPDDDLQLAAVLKSPLLGLGEDALMQLAIGRRRSLWSALHDCKDEPYAAIAATLRGWRAMADQVTPFRFFATLLGPEGGRSRFRARLGGEADDVLDAFLSQALAYETTGGAVSLGGFLRFVRANSSDIKRETEGGAEGVRVMTVHGAKGLEADVVFLADTGGAAVVNQLRKPLLHVGRNRDDPAFLWRRNKAAAPSLQREGDAREDSETESEYLRLLYVAMTRARDVLYVAGMRLIREPPRSWYTIVRDALVPGGVELDAEGELAAPYRWPPEKRAPLAPVGAASGSDAGGAVPLPAWLTDPAPSPPALPEPLRPSAGLAERDGWATTGASAVPGEAARRRGILIHALLDVLPRRSPETRDAASARILAGLDGAEAAALRAEAEAVIALPDLAPLFAATSRAEAAIVGSLGRYAVSGRVDRLARDASGWLVADFKTDRAVPNSADTVNESYVLQMALYRRLLSAIAPGVPVTALLVFTAGPKIIPLPAELMERALARLHPEAMPFP